MYTFSRRYYPKWLTMQSDYKLFCQYVCFLGIEPTTFFAANTMLYHWATGTRGIKPTGTAESNTNVKISSREICMSHDCASERHMYLMCHLYLPFPRQTDSSSTFHQGAICDYSSLFKDINGLLKTSFNVLKMNHGTRFMKPIMIKAHHL